MRGAYRNFEPSQSSNAYDMMNMDLINETNFSIVPDNTIIWDEDTGLPFKVGDVFPTPFLRERANIYATNDALYMGYHSGVYDQVFGFNDFQRDPITNMQIYNVVPNLPDHRVCTDIWCDLLAAKPPRIDGADVEKLSKASSIMSSSNFALAYRKAVKGALILYGNAVFRVDRQTGGSVKVIEMPVKNWIPLVNKEDITTIDVNCFFNIFRATDNMQIGPDFLSIGGEFLCEYILYHENGKVEKITHLYNEGQGTLGEEIHRETGEAFGGLGVSPIVVYSGETVGNTVIGQDAYKVWDASIASSMRAYGTVSILLERLKEIYRLLPDGAIQKDGGSGVTYAAQVGAIKYRQGLEQAPEVKIIVAEVQMEAAKIAYNLALERQSRDTGLAYIMFDPAKLGTSISGTALKTAMYVTELSAKGKATLLTNPTKSLIIKMALAEGIELNPSDFSLLTLSGFVTDMKELAEIIQPRIGNKPTMTRADAIARYEDIPMIEALAIERELDGLPPEKGVGVSSLTDSGQESEVSEVNLTHQSSDPAPSGGNGDGLQYSPFGGGTVNA